MDDDREKSLQRRVLEAARRAQPLNIIGGASKAFYGRVADNRRGEALHTAGHRGVLRYDPGELVLTARAGTRLAEIEELLAGQNQMLGFEPPAFSDAATIGGAVAAGLAGPRRPYAGAVRDFVLGVKLLNGKGEVLGFGGEVMKNVAGFDLARLMAGALGTLGILLEVSLRVIPRPPAQETVLLAQPDPADAIALFNQLAGQPLPLSAAAWRDGETRIRLSGSAAGVASAANAIGGAPDSDSPGGREFWRRLRDHELPFFRGGQPLLRVSLPPAAGVDATGATGEIGATGAAELLDWGGAQRWIAGAVDVEALRQAVAGHGGHVTLFRSADSADRQDAVFHPLDPPLRALHARLKRAFDPAGILNPGRLYPDL